MPLEAKLTALGRMSPAELRSAWRDAFRRPAPDLTPELMARAIAYRLQERQYGGLPPSVHREIARLTRRAVRTGTVEAQHDISLKAGTRLIREWNGRTINVTANDEGFEFEGRQFGSLSQIAESVTGTRWSGPRFFGLKARKPLPSRKKMMHG